MESYWKMLILFIFFIQIWFKVQAATTTLELSTLSNSKNSYLPPLASNNNNNANKSLQQTKVHTVKPQRSIDSFNIRPDLKSQKFSTDPSYPYLYTSYAPPPSGLVSHKNIQLPFGNSVKLPLLLPKSANHRDSTKHAATSASSTAGFAQKDTSPIFLIEEPAAVVLQQQYNKTIEAAKFLASTFLEASTKGNTQTKSRNFENNKPVNATDIYIVNTQKKAYIIPTQFKKEATKPSAVEELYPLREQFEKAYTINQFIFVIKPEKINFLNKLV